VEEDGFEPSVPPRRRTHLVEIFDLSSTSFPRGTEGSNPSSSSGSRVRTRFPESWSPPTVRLPRHCLRYLGRFITERDPLPRVGLRVRIRLPPAGSQQRTVPAVSGTRCASGSTPPGSTSSLLLRAAFAIVRHFGYGVRPIAAAFDKGVPSLHAAGLERGHEVPQRRPVTILERKGARTASWRIPPATTMPGRDAPCSAAPPV